MKVTKRITLLVAPLAVALAMVLSACGGATETPTPTVSTAPTATTASTSPEPTSTTASSSSEPTATTASAGDQVTLTYLVDDSQNTKDTAAALVAAYTAKH